jgi:hypothetical protein
MQITKENNRDKVPLYADGAELYALGQILLRGITAFRAYKNQQSWDIICLSDNRENEWKVQVKYRTEYRRNGNGGAGVSWNNEVDVLVFIENNDGLSSYVIPKSDFATVSTTAGSLTTREETLRPYNDNWKHFDAINQ